MSIEKIDFFNKTVILRTDYNVPIVDGVITSTIRIDSSLRTINYILNQNPRKLIIISHMGRPNGIDHKLSLHPIKQYLESVLQRYVFFSTLTIYKSREPNTIAERIVLLEKGKIVRDIKTDSKTLKELEEYFTK